MSQMLLALERFQRLSEDMANAAKAQEWESLVRSDEERNSLTDNLTTNLTLQLTPSELAQGRAIIERCQQLDTQTRLLVEERQDAIRILLREPKPVI